MKEKINVNSIFVQDRMGYLNPINRLIVEKFVNNDAVTMQISDIKDKDISVEGIHGPQKKIKALALEKLKEKGYESFSFEIGFEGGIVDVLARIGEKTIAVECGPCRISKLIDYLERANTTLWIIKPSDNNYQLYEFNRGRNWDKYMKMYKNYQGQKLEEAKAIVNKAFEDFE